MEFDQWGPEVEVRRSARRRRTVSAYRRDGRLVVLMPAGLSAAQERGWVDRMREQIERREARSRAVSSDEDLMLRARRLSARYFDGTATPTSVRWVDNQVKRWGSCTIATAAIRLSSRLQPMPGWVIDAVLVHELAHLIEPDHGPAFKELEARYEQLDKANGYLLGFATAAGLDITTDLEPGD
ncbi:MAG: M48 metallopeptidase family protein [Nocardioides sp.]